MITETVFFCSLAFQYLIGESVIYSFSHLVVHLITMLFFGYLVVRFLLVNQLSNYLSFVCLFADDHGTIG